MTKAPLRLVQLASGDLWAGAEVQLFQLATALQANDGLRQRVVLLNDCLPIV